MHVFISHAPEDAEIAQRIYHDLKEIPNISPWMADMDLLPGQNRKREIHIAIRDSRYFIPILSSRSVGKAGHVHKEIRLALEALDEMPEGEIFMIPVRIDDCEPTHDRLADLRPADLFPDYGAGVAQIRRSLGAGDEGNVESKTKGTMPVNLKSEQIRRLADALIECPAMRNGRTREQIAECLPPDVSRHIDPGGAVGTVVPEMVDRCMNYQAGIDRLMECVEYHERGSVPFAEARRVKEEMFGVSEPGGDASGPAAPKSPPSGLSTGREPSVAPNLSAEAIGTGVEAVAEPAPGEPKPTPEAGAEQTPGETGENPPSASPEKEQAAEHAVWEKIAAYAFGVVFISVLIGIAIFVPEPKPFQQWIFRVVLSLAAAGVGAVIPGMINVEWKDPKIRAAGAFALFVIVYLLNPPAL